MKCNANGALSGVSKLLTASALSALLVACGGGTTDSQGLLTDGGETDAGLGLDAGETDFGNTDDGFVFGLPDDDSDGIPNQDEGLPCQGRGGSDPGSRNAEWIDNCHIEYEFSDSDSGTVYKGPFYKSTYAKGIQYILYCREEAGAFTQDAWSDGVYGPNTENAVRAFQTAEGLSVDGIVGPETWNRMQTLVDTDDTYISTNGDYDAYGVAQVAEPNAASGINCTQQAHFYAFTNDQFIIESWELAAEPGSTAQGSFSIAEP
jgi:hypothetical protein